MSEELAVLDTLKEQLDRIEAKLDIVGRRLGIVSDDDEYDPIAETLSGMREERRRKAGM